MHQVAERPETLFTHIKRPEWGLAIVAWRGKDRSLYQFEDGQTRTISREYEHLLREEDRPVDAALEVVRNLKAMLRTAGVYDEPQVARTRVERAMTPDEQVAMFLLLYPRGFEEPEYVTKVRGRGAKRHLKRHREGAIKRAADVLSKASMKKRIADDDYTALFNDIMKVMSATDLAPVQELKKLKTATPARKKAFADALFELLYGADEESVGKRLEAFAATQKAILGREPSWEIATVLPALVHPKSHIYVKLSALRSQAKWMAPSLKCGTTPSAAVYERIVAMADAVRSKLVDVGMAPEDLLDVYDFIWATQRPSATQLLHQVRAAKR